MLSNSFKWKHFVGEIILLNVRWYLKYPLSYRNLEEMMAERGVKVDHTTIMRWVHQYSPEIEKKVRRYLRPTNDSWRVDETYIKVKGEWKYFYRAVDSNGDTIDFMLSAKRNKKAAKRFFKKALSSNHNQIPRVITVDKNPAYPSAVNELKNDKILPINVGIRQIKYLNNIIKQDHRSSATRSRIKDCGLTHPLSVWGVCDKKSCPRLWINPSPVRLGCPYCDMRSW
jgi:IS6 family transposase